MHSHWHGHFHVFFRISALAYSAAAAADDDDDNDDKCTKVAFTVTKQSVNKMAAGASS